MEYIEKMMTVQRTYKSNTPWTRYICDFKECQDKLVKYTLKNFWRSRGIETKVKNIHMDKELDLNEDKVKSLLNNNNGEDTEANIMAKVEERLKNLVTKDKMHEHYDGFKVFEQSVDQKLNMIHQTLKGEVDQLKLDKAHDSEDIVSQEEVQNMIRESRGTVLTEIKAMIKNFPAGFDPGLNEISGKTGNLTEFEIKKARAAIVKFGSQSSTATLTQILGYGDEKEELALNIESTFLKNFIKPMGTKNPNGRYTQHLLLENIKSSWAQLMSFLINPGLLNCTQIIAYVKVIYYSLLDLDAENLKFPKNVKILVEMVSAPNNKLPTNIECIRAIEKLVPIANNTKWSYTPVGNINELPKTMSIFTKLKLNRLCQIGYIDAGVAGDALSTIRTRQCFPITSFQENGKNNYDSQGVKFVNKNTLNPGSASTGGFFGDLQEFY
jgi:hypothetical protein